MKSPAPTRRPIKQQGFTLLEILVAFTIMAMSLALLYRSMGSSADAVLRSEQRHHMLTTAQSLLASQSYVGPQGWNEDGETPTLRWRIRSQSHPTTQAATPPTPTARLHLITLTITSKTQATSSYTLTTLRPQRKPLPGEKQP